MWKLKQMSSVWLINTIWSPQATWTEICDYLSANIWAKTVKKEAADPSFLFSVLKFPFKGLFIKGRINFHILLQNPGSNFKILGAAFPPSLRREVLHRLWSRINWLNTYHSRKTSISSPYYWSDKDVKGTLYVGPIWHTPLTKGHYKTY